MRIKLEFTLKQGVGGVFDSDILESRDGKWTLRFNGQGAKEFFENEGGNYSFQRIPPTEKKGRVQTSLISVVVLPVAKIPTVSINKKDLEIRTMRGSGPGGQHRNKTDSAVHIKHIPTGITAYCDMKSQHKSKQMAMDVLISRLESLEKCKFQNNLKKKRASQSGAKGRGGKRRTISEKRNSVVDHKTGKKMKYKDYVRGFIEKLHK